MQQYGFHFAYRLHGGAPTIREFTFADTETLTKGDMVELESDGEIDLAASDDDALLGVVQETKSGTTGVTTIKVICDDDAVYAVYDANARVMGALLDITGATGAMTVAADSDHDLIVVANSAADEPTLVMIIPGAHPLHTLKT